jgi:hypothetical protein
MILYWTVRPRAIVPLVYLGTACGRGRHFWLCFSSECGLRFAVTLPLGLFLVPYLHYQDSLVAFLPDVLGYDCARSRRPKLLRVFRVLILVAMCSENGWQNVFEDKQAVIFVRR